MTLECPSPDCELEFEETSELTEHINDDHPGEYQRDGWPDTPAGREARAQEIIEDEIEEEDQ